MLNNVLKISTNSETYVSNVMVTICTKIKKTTFVLNVLMTMLGGSLLYLLINANNVLLDIILPKIDHVLSVELAMIGMLSKEFV